MSTTEETILIVILAVIFIGLGFVRYRMAQSAEDRRLAAERRREQPKRTKRKRR
jgi:uncharacterized membrane protein YidH (DUF202 family)